MSAPSSRDRGVYEPLDKTMTEVTTDPSHDAAAFTNLGEADPDAVSAFFQPVEPKPVKAKIMLVDDDAVTIQIVRQHLESVGYHDFVICTNAASALDQLRQERPDIVLLDVVMPAVNGLQILRQLREDDEFSRTPVIILTASTNPETKFKALESGATDFLAKPVDPSELVLRVRNVLNVKGFQDHLASYAEGLERAVSQRTAQLVLTQRQVSQSYLAARRKLPSRCCTTSATR